MACLPKNLALALPGAATGEARMILTQTDGQPDLPRYFPQVMQMLQTMRNGRLDIVLPDGRRFRAEGPGPGPDHRWPAGPEADPVEV